MIENDLNQKEPEKKPTPREIFLSVVGWAVAAVLAIIIPVIILYGEPAKVIGIIGAVCSITGIFTLIACTGWQDKNK